MTARDTHNSTVATATKTLAATLLADELTKQETINQSGVNAGFTLQAGNSAYVTAVKNANPAKLASDFAAEQKRQASVMVARDLLRDSGDLGAF